MGAFIFTTSLGETDAEDNMLVRITQQDVVYRRYLDSKHRSYVPDFGVHIRLQGPKGDIEYRTISRQLVLFCVDRR